MKFSRNTGNVLHLDLNFKNFLTITFHYDKILSTVFVHMYLKHNHKKILYIATNDKNIHCTQKVT